MWRSKGPTTGHRAIWHAATLCFALVCCRRPALAQPSLFLLDSSVGSAASLYRVDAESGRLTLLGTFDAAGAEVTGLAAEDDDTLYASTLKGDIIRIQLTPSFAATTLGIVGGSLTDMQFHDGQLYVVDEDTEELADVQVDPWRKTLIGAIRIGGPSGPILDVIGGDISKDRMGNWFLVNNSANRATSRATLYRLDIATAVATEIGSALWTTGRVNGIVF